MKRGKVRLSALVMVESFMLFCFFFSLYKKNASACVLCGFAAVFTIYQITSMLIPNREKEYSSYKRIYAVHLDGVFTYDNRYLTRLLRIISFIGNINPKIGLIYAPKLISVSRSDRERAVVNYFCGVCCDAADDFLKARDYYLNAVRYDGTYRQAWMRLALVYNSLGEENLRDGSFSHAFSAVNYDGNLTAESYIEIAESTRLSTEGWLIACDYINSASSHAVESVITHYAQTIKALLENESGELEKHISYMVSEGVDRNRILYKLDRYLVMNTYSAGKKSDDSVIDMNTDAGPAASSIADNTDGEKAEDKCSSVCEDKK